MNSDSSNTPQRNTESDGHKAQQDANWERFARWHGWLGLACSLCMILLYVIVIAIANAFR